MGKVSGEKIPHRTLKRPLSNKQGRLAGFHVPNAISLPSRKTSPFQSLSPLFLVCVCVCVCVTQSRTSCFCVSDTSSPWVSWFAKIVRRCECYLFRWGSPCCADSFAANCVLFSSFGVYFITLSGWQGCPDCVFRLKLTVLVL